MTTGTPDPVDPADSTSTGRAVDVETVETEHFKPVGTAFILAMFVLTLILLWLSVYVILISRGATT